MSSNEPPVHLHLLSSFEAQWEGVNLIYELEPADEMPETYLSQHFILIPLDNFRATYLLDGRWQHVDYAKGDIAILPATQSLPKTQVDREVPLLELFLETATFDRAAGDWADKIELVPQLQIRDPLIEHMGLALKTELEIGAADSRLYAESMAVALAAHLLRRYCSHPQKIKNCTGGLPNYQLRQAVSYINEHLDRNLTLAEIAAAARMSPNYFASLFKQSTGITPHHYVMQCRIEKAKQLLQCQQLTIVEICHEVGFASQSHFTKVFRQHTQTTPKAYRDAL
ncbi:MAG: helix-turn-helix transcriptional regulator [Microcoleus sp.]